MTIARKNTGKRGEVIARSYLKKQGYRIIEKNYNTRIGEIDIVAIDKDYICFIEVRSINTGRFDAPEYTIDRRKQNQISKAALMYIKRNGLEDRNCRFDVVCVEAVNSPSPDVRLIKDAFELNTRYRY